MVDNNLKNLSTLKVKNHSQLFELQISKYRKKWMEISSKMEQFQTKIEYAKVRAENVVKQPLKFKFPSGFILINFR